MAFSDFFQKLKDRLSGAGQMARTPDFADTFDTTDQPPAVLPIGRGVTSAIGASPSPDAVTSAVDPGDWRIRDKAAVLPAVQSSRLAYSPDMLPDNNGPAPALDMSAGDPLAPRNQQWFNKVKPYMDQAAGGDPIAQREAQAVISGTKINPTKMDRFKQIILPALAGMAQGGANGNGWSGLGGAIAGGLTGAINPQAGAAYRYKTFQQPQDEQMIARENMRVKMERDNQLAQAKAQQEGAAADLARAKAKQASIPPNPWKVSGSGAFNTDTQTWSNNPNTPPPIDTYEQAGVVWSRKTGKPITDQQGNYVPAGSVVTANLNNTAAEARQAKMMEHQRQLKMLDVSAADARFYAGLKQKIDDGERVAPQDLADLAVMFNKRKAEGNVSPDDPVLASIADTFAKQGGYEVGKGDKGYPYIKKASQPAAAGDLNTFDDRDIQEVVKGYAAKGKNFTPEQVKQKMLAAGKKYRGQ